MFQKKNLSVAVLPPSRCFTNIFLLDFPEVNSGLYCGDCMASGEAEEGDGGIPLDIDNVHMLLQGQAIFALT